MKKRPSFRSDRYQFTVVLPNLNYDVTQDVTQDNLDIQIIKLIRKNNKISADKIAKALEGSTRTIKRHIKEIDNVIDNKKKCCRENKIAYTR